MLHCIHNSQSGKLIPAINKFPVTFHKVLMCLRCITRIFYALTFGVSVKQNIAIRSIPGSYLLRTLLVPASLFSSSYRSEAGTNRIRFRRVPDQNYTSHSACFQSITSRQFLCFQLISKKKQKKFHFPLG